MPSERTPELTKSEYVCCNIMLDLILVQMEMSQHKIRKQESLKLQYVAPRFKLSRDITNYYRPENVPAFFFFLFSIVTKEVSDVASKA